MSKEAVEKLTQWVAAIADNIRNPVAGMSAALDIVTRQLELKRQTGHCDEALIDDACRRMRSRFASLHQYITELVDFGRPLRLNVSRLSFEGFLTPFLNSTTSTLRDFGDISLGLDVAHEAKDTFVAIDPERMAVVVHSLLRNAVEAALVGGFPRVHMVVERAESPAVPGIKLHVDDNGPGFDPLCTERPFEPFYSTKEAGTGLGLSLVRKYVEAHGGSVALGTSPLLGGARVTVFLPDHGSQALVFESL